MASLVEAPVSESETQPMQQEEMDRSTENEEKPNKTKKVSFAFDNVKADQQRMNFFLNPMMKELETQVAKNTEILDRLNKQLEDERNARIKARETAHIPEALKGCGQEMSSIMRTVEDLILLGDEVNEEEGGDTEQQESEDTMEAREAEEDEEEEEGCEEEFQRRTPLNKLQILDEHCQAAITAHSVAAYVSTLEEESLKQLTSKITQDCELWLSRLFRFPNSSAVYHEEHRDGIVKICRMALYQKYPKYAVEGFEALYSRPPVIYVSSAAMPGLGNYICLQLGLPMSCICNVPCKGSTSKMDVKMLEKLIQDDISAAKTPVLLIGFAGSPHLGHVDDLKSLQEVCKKHEIWLHIEGNNLSLMVRVSVPTSLQPVKSGDSMTVALGKWLGIPGLPYSTLYKKSDPALEHAAGLNTFVTPLKLNCLPLWIVLQSLGHDGIVDRIKHSCKLADKIDKFLQDIPTIKKIGYEKKEKEPEPKSLSEMLFSAIDALFVFRISNPTVVFRYVEDTSSTGIEIAPYSPISPQEDKENQENKNIYFNALNSWLCDTLVTENPNVDVFLIDVEKEGNCIKYSPLDSAIVRGTVEDDIEAFNKCLQKQLGILDATVLQRDQFRAIVEAQDNVRLIDMPNWAGLGVVQYMPEEWREHMTDLPENAKKEINKINVELVHRLHSKDTAFSLGYNDDDIGCVKFGLITNETDVEELIGLVCTLGKEIEESSKYLEVLAEKIQKGIEEANIALQKETDEKLIQEGTLRQVPFVSSLINWWSPPPKDVMKGRTFSLSTGTIASTEKTYKYHMQIQEDAAPKESPQSPTQQHTYKEILKPVISDTKSAGAVKANLAHEVNASQNSSQGHNESLPTQTGDKGNHNTNIDKESTS